MLDTGGKEDSFHFENQNHPSVIFMCRAVFQHLSTYWCLVPLGPLKEQPVFTEPLLQSKSCSLWVWWDTLATQPAEKQKNCTCYSPPGKPSKSCFLNLFPLHLGSQSFRTQQVTSPRYTKGLKLTAFLIFWQVASNPPWSSNFCLLNAGMAGRSRGQNRPSWSTHSRLAKAIQ